MATIQSEREIETETAHESYEEARARCVEEGATHAVEPSGKCQTFYAYVEGTDGGWACAVVFLRPDGWWVKGGWMFDYDPPVATMAALEFVSHIAGEGEGTLFDEGLEAPTARTYRDSRKYTTAMLAHWVVDPSFRPLLRGRIGEQDDGAPLAAWELLRYLEAIEVEMPNWKAKRLPPADGIPRKRGRPSNAEREARQKRGL